MSQFDEASAQQAVATVVQFPLKIHETAQAAQGVVLGPWTLQIRCNYGTSDKNHYVSSTVFDFAAPRAALQQALKAAEAEASRFLPAFQPVQTWLAVTLPRTGAQFSDAVKAQAKAKTELKASGAVSAATKLALVAALRGLLNELQTSKSTLGDATQALAQFEQEVEASIKQVASAKADMTTQGQAYLASLKSGIAKAPCGQSGALRQLTALNLQFGAAVASYAVIFSRLTTETQAATRAVSLLAGTVMTFENKYSPIVAQVQKAEGAALGTVMQTFDLAVASSQWNGLVNYAKSQLDDAKATLRSQLVAIAKVPADHARFKAVLMERSKGAAETPSTVLTARVESAVESVYGVSEAA